MAKIPANRAKADARTRTGDPFITRDGRATGADYRRRSEASIRAVFPDVGKSPPVGDGRTRGRVVDAREHGCLN
jgi:hypothetical protein